MNKIIKAGMHNVRPGTKVWYQSFVKIEGIEMHDVRSGTSQYQLLVVLAAISDPVGKIP